MLRGTDANNDGPDESTTVDIAQGAAWTGELTVYFRDSPPEYVRDRQRIVLDVVEALEAAGAVDSVSIVGWPKRVRDSSSGHEAAAVDTYAEFVDAVGRRSLEPFFEEKPATGRADRVVVFPAICVALRIEGSVVGLYPHWSDGTHYSIEDCLEALAAGESLANVE